MAKNKKAQSLIEYFLIALLIIIPGVYALAPYFQGVSDLINVNSPQKNQKALLALNNQEIPPVVGVIASTADEVLKHLFVTPNTPVDFDNINKELFDKNTVGSMDSIIFFQTSSNKAFNLFNDLGFLASTPFSYTDWQGATQKFSTMKLDVLTKIKESVSNGTIILSNPSHTLDKGDYTLKFYNEGDMDKYLSPEHAQLGDALLGESLPEGFDKFQLTTQELEYVPHIGSAVSSFDGGADQPSNWSVFNLTKVPTHFEYITMTPKDGSPATTIRNPYYSGPGFWFRENSAGQIIMNVGTDAEFLPVYLEDHYNTDWNG